MCDPEMSPGTHLKNEVLPEQEKELPTEEGTAHGAENQRRNPHLKTRTRTLFLVPLYDTTFSSRSTNI